MSTPLTRRRFIAIAATLAAGAGIPFAISRKTNRPTHSAGPNQEEQPVIWKGIALGSGAELRLFGVGRRQAEILINKVLAEVSRLEKIFSLYRDDSLISRLNREGRLKNPPSDFLQLLSISRDIHQLTQGAFDPSIQPLWNLYADHFRRNPKTETPPSERSIKDTLKLVDFNKVNFDTKEIRFAQKGMGLSLNFATSGGYGTVMDEAGKFTHLFDPRTGGSQPRYKSMSVMAESAAVADAFSTAFSIMDEAAIRAAAQVKNAQVWLVMPNNELKKI